MHLLKMILLHCAGFVTLMACVGDSSWAQAGTEGSVRDAVVSLRYVPAIPSKLGTEWEPWRKEAQSLIEVLGAGAESRANADDIAYESIRAGLDTELVFAVVEVASKFDEFATSPSGLGLMGLPLRVQSEFGRKENTLWMGKYNLRLGCSLLRELLDRHKGDLYAALAAFLQNNGVGPTLSEVVRVYEARRLKLAKLKPLNR